MLLLPTDACSLKRPENKGVNMKKVKISVYKERLLAVNAPPWIGVYLAVSTTGVCRVCEWLPLTASLAPFPLGHDPHRRHQGRPTLWGFLHSADSQLWRGERCGQWCGGCRWELGMEWGVFKCFISHFYFLFFFPHFYFQESLQLAFEVSELDRLAAWGLEGGAGPVRSCCVSLLWSISSQDLSLRVAGSPPSLLFPNMGGFTACSYPSLPIWQLLFSLDRSGQSLQAETVKLCFDTRGASHVLPSERPCGSPFVPIARASACRCFEASSRGHCCAVGYATGALLQG